MYFKHVFLGHKGRPLNIIIFIIMYLLSTAILYSQDQSEPGKDDGKDRYILNLSADPVGFLTLGPSIEVDFALARFLGISGGVRIPSLSLLVKALYPNMTSAWAANGGLRVYFGKQLYARGFYLGPRLEYGKSNYETSSFQLLGFGLQVGYRWLINRRFSIDLSDNIGPVLSKGSSDWNFDMFVFYMLSIKFGFAL